MATNNSNRGSSSNRSSNGSNKSNSRSTMGRAQDMAGEWGGTVKERPIVSAAAAAGAVAAGVFLWSKRNQISGQISRLSDQITDWADEMRSSDGNSRALMKTGGPNESDAIEASRATKRKSSPRSMGSASRSTSGQSATTGQNMNAGRASSETVSY